jgi:hypothetical protein
MKIDDSKPKVHLFATFLKKEICIMISFQFCKIQNLSNVSKKLAKVVEFTVKLNISKAFPNFCQKNEKIFLEKSLKFCMIKKEK